MLITFGVKEKGTTVWDGQISTSMRKIVAIQVGKGNAKKSSAKAGKFSLKSAVNKKAPKNSVPPALRVTVDAPAEARVKVTTKRCDFDFALSDLPSTGAASPHLQGNVTVTASTASSA